MTNINLFDIISEFPDFYYSEFENSEEEEFSFKLNGINNPEKRDATNSKYQNSDGYFVFKATSLKNYKHIGLRKGTKITLYLPYKSFSYALNLWFNSHAEQIELLKNNVLDCVDITFKRRSRSMLITELVI